VVTRPESVADVLRRDLARLTPQERRVARAMLADYPRAALRTSGELATAAGVSAPTVVRCARKLGFAGFTDLQSQVVDELSERQASPVTRFQERPGSDGHWLDRGLEAVVGGVTASLQAIPRAELDRAAELLSDDRLAVSAFGGRYSGLVARYLLMHLQQVRPGVRLQDELTLSGVGEIVDARRAELYVVYDLRRYQTSTVERARRLADAGARIICITDPWLSPVAQVADVVLPTAVHSDQAFDSAAAAFVLTELLVDGVLQHRGPAALDRMRRWDEVSRSAVLDDSPLPPED